MSEKKFSLSQIHTKSDWKNFIQFSSRSSLHLKYPLVNLHDDFWSNFGTLVSTLSLFSLRERERAAEKEIELKKVEVLIENGNGFLTILVIMAPNFDELSRGQVFQFLSLWITKLIHEITLFLWCRHSSLLILFWFSSGSFLVLFWFSSDSLLILFWFLLLSITTLFLPSTATIEQVLFCSKYDTMSDDQPESLWQRR